jgi:two-component system response regulator BaeR
MNRILIIEDEADLAEVLQDYLQHHHYDAQIINDGAQVMRALQDYRPDLILLDLMLPNKDGLAICREIRAQSNVPIIMVTAKVEEIDRLLGLELGADDYICKPYSPREVIARVKAVLRRTLSDETASQPEYTRTTDTNHSLLMDENTLTANLNGHELILTAVEFRLLKTLSSEPRRIFTRDQLMDRIYDDQRIVHDRTIDSHINKLRKKLAAANAGAEVLHSVYGVGYKYDASV